MGDKFGVDHARLRAEEKRDALEKINQKTSIKLLEEQAVENARTNFTYLWLDNARQTKSSQEEFNVEDFFAERRKKRQEIRENLLAQIKEREAALSTAKQKKSEMDRKERDSYRKAIEQQERSQLQERQHKIAEGKLQLAQLQEARRLKKVTPRSA